MEAASSSPLSYPLAHSAHNRMPMSQMLPSSTGKPKVWLWRVCPRWCSSSRHDMNMLAVGHSRKMNRIHLRVSGSIYQVSRACGDAQLSRNVGTVEVCSLLGHNTKSRQAKSEWKGGWVMRTCGLYLPGSPKSLYLWRTLCLHDGIYCYHGIELAVITRVLLFLKQDVLGWYADLTTWHSSCNLEVESQ